MSEAFAIRPARKSDAAEIALLVNIAVHGNLARGWANSPQARDTYEPLEVGRLEMLRDDTEFGWRSASIAEVADEVTGMLLGYRKPDEVVPVADDVWAPMRPIEELEAEAAGLWFVSMLGVHKTWRGRGTGSALLAHAEAEAQRTRAHGLGLIVGSSNPGATKLYAGRGYAVKASRPMVTFPGSVPDASDWLLMVKE